jgi:hypothetical protein
MRSRFAPTRFFGYYAFYATHSMGREGDRMRS